MQLKESSCWRLALLFIPFIRSLTRLAIPFIRSLTRLARKSRTYYESGTEWLNGFLFFSLRSADSQIVSVLRQCRKKEEEKERKKERRKKRKKEKWKGKRCSIPCRSGVSRCMLHAACVSGCNSHTGQETESSALLTRGRTGRDCERLTDPRTRNTRKTFSHVSVRKKR